VKKYANRRLYNTESSSYVTLEDLAEMVRKGRDFVVYDAKTGEDITRAVLTQIIVDMRNQLAKAKQQVAAAIADEKRLRDQADSEFKLADDWEKRAMLAVQQGRDDLATQALLRQQEHLEHAQTLAMTWETHRNETEALKQSLRDLNDKIEEAKRKKNLLLARQRRAEAQQRISQTMSGLSENSAFEAFNRMEEKITSNERQLAAAREIDAEFTGEETQLRQGIADVLRLAHVRRDVVLDLVPRVDDDPSATVATAGLTDGVFQPVTYLR
jgi:phage shock protein A